MIVAILVASCLSASETTRNLDREVSVIRAHMEALSSAVKSQNLKVVQAWTDSLGSKFTYEDSQGTRDSSWFAKNLQAMAEDSNDVWRIDEKILTSRRLISGLVEVETLFSYKRTKIDRQGMFGKRGGILEYTDSIPSKILVRLEGDSVTVERIQRDLPKVEVTK